MLLRSVANHYSPASTNSLLRTGSRNAIGRIPGHHRLTILSLGCEIGYNHLVFEAYHPPDLYRTAAARRSRERGPKPRPGERRLRDV
jgi:hypothetical protein